MHDHSKTDIHHHHAFLVTRLLRPGFLLSRDVTDCDGLLVAAEGVLLTEEIIAEMHTKGLIGAWVRQKHKASGLLPAVKSPEPVEAPRAAAPTPVDDRQTILIADDEPNIRRILRYVLEKAKFKVVEAGTGTQVLEVVAKQRVDAILMDSMIAPVTGLSTCRILKGNLGTQHIKVVVCSARVDDAHYQEAWEAGADDFIAKPFQMENVIHTLQVHLAAGSSGAQ